MTKAAVLMIEGYEESETIQIVDLLRRADIETHTFRFQEDPFVLSMQGMYIKAEKKSSKIMSAIFMAFTFWVLVLNNTFGAYLAALGMVVVVFVLLFFRLKSRFTTAIMPFAVFVSEKYASPFIV